MDKEFSWNLPDINTIREKREREQLGMAGAEQLKARRALKLQNDLDMAQQAQQDEAARQAQYARWMELENKFAGRTMDPNMKMAAMLTMAGQPALMQQLFMNKSTNSTEAQSEMDSLESSMAGDMFALASADNETYDKLTKAIIPLYKSKFEDLVSKGAKSRLGASWDEGWGLHLSRGEAERKRRKTKQKEKEDSLEGMLPG